jgi:hypothetical protein
MLYIASPLSLIFHRRIIDNFSASYLYRIHHSAILLIDLFRAVVHSTTTLKMTYNERLPVPAAFASMTTVLAATPTPIFAPVRHIPDLCLKEREDEEEDVDMVSTDNKWPTTTTPPSTPNVSSGIPAAGGHRVAFSKIEIIELPYSLGDNPCCMGPPIAPSWIAQKRTTLDLEFFERYRPERRSKNALLLSRQARKSL